MRLRVSVGADKRFREAAPITIRRARVHESGRCPRLRSPVPGHHAIAVATKHLRRQRAPSARARRARSHGSAESRLA